MRSEETLRRYTERQGELRWGSEYQPAIRATREEAPRCSRPTVLRPRKLGGREMHLLSDPETYSALLALHNPAVFDVHEQHVLDVLPTQHPVAALSDAKLLQLPSLPGTLEVADWLDMFDAHPKVFVDSLGEGGGWVPIPYVGDLLLFLRDERGPYSVNWTIKLETKDFRRAGWRRLRASEPPPATDDLRHQLEAAHFAEADIPTHQIALAELDPNLCQNLRRAFIYDARPYSVEAAVRAAMIDRFRAIVGTQVLLFDEIRRQAAEHGVPEEDARAVFHSAVWCREIRIDLFRPLVADRPLRAERIDPLKHHAAWFGR
jgi:hypothetical protein